MIAWHKTNKISKSIIIVLLAGFLSACADSQRLTQEEELLSSFTYLDNSPFSKKSDPFFSEFKSSLSNEKESLTKVKSKILDQYSDWKGVRYKLGGSTKKGVDCSAFVQITFKEQFGVELPRTTLGQRNIGTAINKSKLKAGDLVLFNTRRTTRHIGIYLGNNKFVHASSSQGVMISDLHNSYWSKRYTSARRVIANSTHS